MKRRSLLQGLAGCIAGPPSAVWAQLAGRPWRIGYLAASANPQRAYFHEELQRLGYGPGRVQFEHRDAQGDFGLLPAMARELVAIPVDLIVTQVTQATIAARAATATIPIVMIGVSDPVAAGLVASLARPGGNVTGTSAVVGNVVGKQLEVLRDLFPGLVRLPVLWNPANPVFQKQQVGELHAAAAQLGMQVQLHEASSAAAMDASFAAIAAGAPRAVLVLGDPLFTTYATRLAELALRHRLPCVGLTRPLAEAGMLASYGPSFEDAFRRAAYYVDRILKGAKPAELPVDRSLRFELVLNRRTARALNIEFPPSVVVRADQLID